MPSSAVGMKNESNWARLLAYVTGLVNQELLLQNEYLAAAPASNEDKRTRRTLKEYAV